MNPERYAIIRNESVTIPGDERSRQAPGHGYSAHTITNAVFKEYDTKEKWEKEINELANPRYGTPEKFWAIVFREVEVTRNVTIQIK